MELQVSMSMKRRKPSFRDLSDQVLQDDVLARLLTFPNVLITAHQGFLTREALANIAETTLSNVRAFEQGEPLVNELRAEHVLRDAEPAPAGHQHPGQK